MTTEIAKPRRMEVWNGYIWVCPQCKVGTLLPPYPMATQGLFRCNRHGEHRWNREGKEWTQA